VVKMMMMRLQKESRIDEVELKPEKSGERAD
jgi:hypothetical protein